MPGGGPQRDVFRSGRHWSYPYVFEDGGETHCIPETADAGRTTLHRRTASGWVEQATLLEGEAVLDPSLVRHDGRYWLFCSHREGGLLNTALHLYMSDDLAGPYRPHPENLVKLDVRSARPGGTIFRAGGALHRPGQDCAGDYGAALVVNRIDELTEHRYQETPVLHLRPQRPYGAGLHTLSFTDGWAAIDAKRTVFSPLMLGYRLAAARRRARCASSER
jgi:hypothetical protein